MKETLFFVSGMGQKSIQIKMTQHRKQSGEIGTAFATDDISVRLLEHETPKGVKPEEMLFRVRPLAVKPLKYGLNNLDAFHAFQALTRKAIHEKADTLIINNQKITVNDCRTHCCLTVEGDPV